MTDSNVSALATADDVRQALARRGTPLLLNFTAGWCQPCKTFAPVLAAIAGAHGDAIDILRVDIDASRDLAREFGVRGVPTTILVRDGAEQDRLVGARSQRGFAQWLAARGVPLPVQPDDHASRFAFGAFHGDEGLKRFLVERFYGHMDNGEAASRMFPSWQDGSGSVSGALVHHGSPDVFECVTGLPYGFACALEFVGLERRGDAEEVFEALAPGRDVRGVPLQLMRAFLGSDAIDWAGALGSAAHDALRRDWLAASADDVSAERWAALRKAARALVTPDEDPYRMLEDDLATLVECLSPPPAPHDVDAWRTILVRSGYAKARLTEYEAGWTKDDSARPALRHRFFEQHVPVDGDGRFDTALFEAKRAEWERDNADFVALEHAWFAANPFMRLHARFRPILADLLRGT